MSGEPEILGGHWGTFAQAEASVLVVVHSHACLLRIKEYAQLLVGDPRIRLYWTVAPDRFNADVAGYLSRLGVHVLDWQDALERTFDLVICASLHQIGYLNAKRKFAAPHGCGYGKCYPGWAWPAGDTPPVYGLDRESLLDKNGEPVFDGIVVPHPHDLQVLVQQTPESARSALLCGDLAYDRLLASLPHRERYRHDFRVGRQQILVALAGTWGSMSLLARFPDLPAWLLGHLPADHRLIMTMHPAVWCEHTPWQVREKLRDAAERGLELLAPDDDWRRLVAAADVIISDHTSITPYAAGAGIPVLISHVATEEIAPTSLMAQLARVSPVLDLETPILEQLDAARQAGQRQHRIAHPRVSSTPGKSAAMARRAMYRLLNLAEPKRAPRVERVPFVEVDFRKFLG